jgi:hypothetical protein
MRSPRVPGTTSGRVGRHRTVAPVPSPARKRQTANSSGVLIWLHVARAAPPRAALSSSTERMLCRSAALPAQNVDSEIPAINATYPVEVTERLQRNSACSDLKKTPKDQPASHERAWLRIRRRRSASDRLRRALSSGLAAPEPRGKTRLEGGGAASVCPCPLTITRV